MRRYFGACEFPTGSIEYNLACNSSRTPRLLPRSPIPQVVQKLEPSLGRTTKGTYVVITWSRSMSVEREDQDQDGETPLRDMTLSRSNQQRTPFFWCLSATASWPNSPFPKKHMRKTCVNGLLGICGPVQLCGCIPSPFFVAPTVCTTNHARITCCAEKTHKPDCNTS